MRCITMYSPCCCRSVSCSEYLTGFHKRKQERRRFGLDMEAFKQQKRLLEARKQVRPCALSNPKRPHSAGIHVHICMHH